MINNRWFDLICTILLSQTMIIKKIWALKECKPKLYPIVKFVWLIITVYEWTTFNVLKIHFFAGIIVTFVIHITFFFIKQLQIESITDEWIYYIVITMQYGLWRNVYRTLRKPLHIVMIGTIKALLYRWLWRFLWRII